jgi:hypothetical protein
MEFRVLDVLLQNDCIVKDMKDGSRHGQNTKCVQHFSSEISNQKKIPKFQGSRYGRC